MRPIYAQNFFSSKNVYGGSFQNNSTNSKKNPSNTNSTRNTIDDSTSTRNTSDKSKNTTNNILKIEKSETLPEPSESSTHFSEQTSQYTEDEDDGDYDLEENNESNKEIDSMTFSNLSLMRGILDQIKSRNQKISVTRFIELSIYKNPDISLKQLINDIRYVFNL